VCRAQLDLPPNLSQDGLLEPIPVLLKLVGCLPLELGPQMEPAPWSLSNPLDATDFGYGPLSLAGSRARNDNDDRRDRF
jgi:hypothetical protein